MLALAGTAAVHVILAVFVDAMVVTHPIVIPPPAPHIELFEVKVEPPPEPKPPPPPVEPEPEPEPKTPPKVPPPRIARPQPRIRQPVQPPPETPPPATTPSPDSGGAPVVHIDNLAPDARGTVPVVAGPGGSRYVGRGGHGTGTGAGTGKGSASAPPKPVSIATIKTRALPKGDYGYIDATRDYPPEARRLGIEGPIRVRLVVDVRGKVASAVLLNRLGHGLDALALERAKKIEFEPARDTDDKPVSSVVVWTFNMVLPKT